MSENDAEFIEIMMQDGDWQPGSRMHRLALLARRGADAAARIAQLEAALRPFAARTNSEEYIKSAPDHGLCAAISYTAGDYRRARAALEERT